MTSSEILEIGQKDFDTVLNDYRVAKLSWQHLLAAHGDLDSEPNSVRAAVISARIDSPFSYILDVLVFDVLLAIARLADDGRERGASERLSLLTIQSHLVSKRSLTSDAPLLSLIDLANSQTANFRHHHLVRRIRERRNTHLAHRLRLPPSELKYGDLEGVLAVLTELFMVLAPLFHASKDYPESVPMLRSHSTAKYWKCFELGATAYEHSPSKDDA